MNDEQLVELLESKTAEELSPEEIDQLRQRLPHSPPLRAALSERLRLEANLAEVLGSGSLSVDDILAESTPRPKEGIALPLFGLLACLVIIGISVAAYVVSLNRRLDREQEVASTDVDAATPEDGQPSETTDGETPGDDAIPPNATPPDPGEPPDAENPDAVQPVAEVKFPLHIEAAAFARGNVQIDKEDWGAADEPVIVSGDARPSLAEYEFDLPRAGKFQLRLRYAAFDSRPLELSINGKQVKGQVAGEQTGGPWLANQRWVPAGEHEFVAGKNVLRLATSFKYPHVSRIEIDDPTQVAAVDPVAPPDVPMPADPETPDPKDPAGGDPPVAPVKTTPWQAVVDANTDELPRFEDVCFDTFNTKLSLPRRDDLHAWVAPVDGQRYQVYDANTHLGRCAAFEGIVRLKSPWLEDAALRLSLENYNKLKIHFFHKNQGVTLAYYEPERFRWAAYTTTRDANAARPKSYALTATDDGRCRRTEIRFGGPFELRYLDGEVILSRGDIVLLRAPLPGPPEEVYLDGRASFHGIALVRSTGFPAPPQPLPLIEEVERPADLPWHEQLAEKAHVEKTDEGFIRLAADRTSDRSWIATPIPGSGIKLVELEVENVTPGAGVFIYRGDQPPRDVVTLMQNRRDDTYVWMMRGDDVREGNWNGVDEHTWPQAAPRQWIRLLFGQGQIRWWVSVDGVHWAEPETPRTFREAGATHVGLHTIRVAPDCGITLRRLRVRQLAHLTALADPDVLQQAMAKVDLAKPDLMFEVLKAQKPDDVDKSAWRRACAVAVLAEGPTQKTGETALAALLDDPHTHSLPPERQLAVLDEAARLFDTSNRDYTLGIVRRYHEVGLRAEGEAGARPFSLVRKSLMESPLRDEQNFAISNVAPVRAELIELVYRQDWPAVLAFCKLLHFYQQHQETPLVEWAETLAVQGQPGRPGSVDFTRLKDEWRQPLVEEFSKQAYNLTAELESLLASDAYDAAARMITSLDEEAVRGVAPAAHDRRLLVSIPSAVRLAVRRHPQLAQVVNEKYGELARLRIRQAIEAGDVRAVELAAVQFEATDAAAEAHQWLGDRALSTGWFARALSEYQRGERTAGVLLRRGLQSRMRLAAAMLGREVGEPVSGSVQFGETRMTAEEFETLVAEMIARHGGQASQLVEAIEVARPIPPPGEFTLEKRDTLEGPWGESPASEITRHVRRYHVPWVDRQLSVVRAGDVLYASNRFQVSAFNLADGKRLWRSEQPPGRMLRAQDWALTPMRPLVTGGRLYTRLLFGDGPMLVALERDSGKLVWRAERPSRESIISDPLLVQEKLACFTITRGEQQENLLQLVTLDPDTGETLEQDEVLRLRDSWWTRRYFAATALDDGLVASLGGATFCCDLSGNLRWVRTQTVLPTEEESSWVTQRFQPPLVRGGKLHGGKLYVAQAGVRTVECLDPESGDALWTRILPDVHGILGFATGRVIVEEENRITALDAATGQAAWHTEVQRRLDAAVCDDKHLVLACRQPVTDANGPQRVALIWLNPADGAQQGEAVFSQLEHRAPYLGGLVPDGNRLFAFYGAGDDEPRRELVELKRK